MGCLAVNTVSSVAATSVSARQPASSGSTMPSLVIGPYTRLARLRLRRDLSSR